MRLTINGIYPKVPCGFDLGSVRKVGLDELLLGLLFSLFSPRERCFEPKFQHRVSISPFFFAKISTPNDPSPDPEIIGKGWPEICFSATPRGREPEPQIGRTGGEEGESGRD